MRAWKELKTVKQEFAVKIQILWATDSISPLAASTLGQERVQMNQISTSGPEFDVSPSL